MTWRTQPTFGNWHEWALERHTHAFANVLVSDCAACARIIWRELGIWRR